MTMCIPNISLASPLGQATTTSTKSGQATEKKAKKKKNRKRKRKKTAAKRKRKQGQGKVKTTLKKTKKSVKKAVGKTANSKVGKVAGRQVKGAISKIGFEGLLGKSKEAKKLIQCLAGVKKLSDLPEDVRNLLTRPGKVVMTKFQDAWHATSKATKKHLRNASPPKKAADMPRFAWELQLKIMTEAGKTSDDIKVLACIINSLNPKFKETEPKLRVMVKTMQKAVKTKWEKEIRPTMTKKVTEVMIKRLREGERGQRIVDATLRVTGKILLAVDKVEALESKLKTYKKALAAKDKGRIKGSFKQVKRSLQEGVDPGKVLVLVTEELVQEELEKVIDKKFTPIVDKVIAAASSGLAIVNGVIDGACGLIPEAGAAVCTALITRTLRLSYDWVVGQYLRNTIIAKAKELTNRMVKYVGAIAYEVAFKKVDAQYAKLKKQYGGRAKEIKRVLKPYITIVKNEVFPAVKAINDQRAQMLAVLEQVNASATAASK
jgi:hypothetical protein